MALVVQPIAFVCEHAETLVELDIEYRRLAATMGVKSYRRVPTVDEGPSFIAGLTGLVRQLTDSRADLCSQAGRRLCPAHCAGCPLNKNP